MSEYNVCTVNIFIELSAVLSRSGNSTTNVIGKVYMTLDQSVLRITAQLSG